MASLDYSQPVNQVRLLIPDIVKLEDPKDLRKPPSYIFSDMELFGFLAIEGGTSRRPPPGLLWRSPHLRR